MPTKGSNQGFQGSAMATQSPQSQDAAEKVRLMVAASDESGLLKHR